MNKKDGVDNRNPATFKQLYNTVKHLTGDTFYADHWQTFARALYLKCNGMGKLGTIAMDQDNSNKRGHLTCCDQILIKILT